MRKDITHKIMAITPGVRYLAIAIFEGATLREWRIKCLPSKERKRKLSKVKEILAEFIERYHPTSLAIKRLHPARSSASLDILKRSIRECCLGQGLKLYSYSIEELETSLSGSRMNKKKLAEIVTELYPELAPELEKEQKNRNAYFVRLFEAVALGHVCLNEISHKQ